MDNTNGQHKWTTSIAKKGKKKTGTKENWGDSTPRGKPTHQVNLQSLESWYDHLSFLPGLEHIVRSKRFLNPCSAEGSLSLEQVVV
jgi:hypothetical protein